MLPTGYEEENARRSSSSETADREVHGRRSLPVSLGEWVTRTDGDADVTASGDAATIRVYKCSSGVAERAVGTGTFTVSFDWELEAEGWWEAPFFEIVENGDPVYTGSVNEESTHREGDLERLFEAEAYGTTSGSVRMVWDSDAPMSIRFALLPSSYCSNSDHGTTWFRVTDLRVTEGERTATPSSTRTSMSSPTPSVTATLPATPSESPTQTATRTARPSATPTRTPLPEFTRGERTVVDVGGDRYYVYRGFQPNSDAIAVADQRDDLVGRTATVDALVTDAFSGVDKYGYNWDEVRRAAKDRRRDARALELLNQGAKLGVDVVEAYIAVRNTKANVLDRVSAFYDVAYTAIDWALTELNDPYERAFVNMAAACEFPANLETNPVTSIGDARDGFAGTVGTAIDAVNALSEGDRVGLGVAIATQASESAGVSPSAEQAIQTSAQMVPGAAFDMPVATFEKGLDVRARIGGILDAYESVRIPMMKTLEGLIQHLEGNSMHAGHATQFYSTLAAYHYIGAVAYDATAELFKNLDELSRFTGGLWDFVDDTDEQIDHYAGGVGHRLDASRLAIRTMGEGFRMARRNYDATLNRRIHGDLEDKHFGGVWS